MDLDFFFPHGFCGINVRSKAGLYTTCWNSAIMEPNSPVVKCGKCLAVLDDAPNIPVEQRTPCPNCGSTARVFEVEIIATAIARESFGMKARHGAGGRPFYESKSGANLHRATDRWMQRDLVVDRESDRYIERVVDPDTGKIVHVCEEPLSKHQGHGTAKKKSSDKRKREAP